MITEKYSRHYLAVAQTGLHTVQLFCAVILTPQAVFSQENLRGLHILFRAEIS